MWPPAVTGMLGVWLAAAPDVMGYGGHARLSNQFVGVWMAAFGAIGSLVAGIAAISLALVRAPLRERFGGGWTSLWRQAER